MFKTNDVFEICPAKVASVQVTLDEEYSDRHVYSVMEGEYLNLNFVAGVLRDSMLLGFVPKKAYTRTEYKNETEPLLGEFWD